MDRLSRGDYWPSREGDASGRAPGAGGITFINADREAGLERLPGSFIWLAGVLHSAFRRLISHSSNPYPTKDDPVAREPRPHGQQRTTLKGAGLSAEHEV